MFRTPSNLSHAQERRDLSSNAARLRHCLRRIAAPLAGLLFATAAHAVPLAAFLVAQVTPQAPQFVLSVETSFSHPFRRLLSQSS